MTHQHTQLEYTLFMAITLLYIGTLAYLGVLHNILAYLGVLHDTSTMQPEWKGDTERERLPQSAM